MARFVCFTDGLVGSLQRTVELGRRLVEAGHEVVVACPLDVTAEADRAGLRAVRLDRLEALRDELDRLPRPSPRRPGALVGWLRAGRAARRASLADRSIERVLDEFRPDLALVEMEFHTAGIACRAAGVPTVLVTGFFCTMPESGAPPLDTDLRPGVDSAASIAEAWESTIRGHRRVLRRAVLSVSGAASAFRPVRPMTWHPVDLRSFARSRGLRLRDLMASDQWLRPFALADPPIVSLTPEALEFAPAVPTRWHTVGAVLPGPDIAVDRTTAADRAVLDDLLGRRRNGDGDRRLVYVALGTYWGRGAPLLRTLLAALSQRPDLDVVVGLGGATQRSALDAVPDHVLLMDWAPQAELLAHADAAIVHGGVTTLTECAAAAVPMVCCSTHTNEQDGNVARVVHAGIAVALDHRGLTTSQVLEALEHVLSDGDVRARSDDAATAMAAESGSDRAVRTLEALLRSADRSAPSGAGSGRLRP